MIRWYDYVSAYVAAELIWANIQLAWYADVWWLGILAGLSAALIFDFWGDMYCRFRLKQEIARGK